MCFVKSVSGERDVVQSELANKIVQNEPAEFLSSYFIENGEERSIVCALMTENKLTENACYGNQPLEDLFYSIDANSSCSVTKQDFVFKEAYLEVQFRFQALTGNSCFQCFLQTLFGNNLILH